MKLAVAVAGFAVAAAAAAANEKRCQLISSALYLAEARRRPDPACVDPKTAG